MVPFEAAFADDEVAEIPAGEETVETQVVRVVVLVGSLEEGQVEAGNVAYSVEVEIAVDEVADID